MLLEDEKLEVRQSASATLVVMAGHLETEDVGQVMLWNQSADVLCYCAGKTATSKLGDSVL
jgi:hypothetical protein